MTRTPPTPASARSRCATRALSGLLAVLLLAAGPAAAQGRFGKNKVHYQSFDWHLYKAPHFDIYYYPESEPFLGQMVSYAESAYLYLTKALDHEPKFRVPLIYYRTHAEFEQTNVSLSEIGQGTLAFAEPLVHRVVLAIDQPPDKLYEVLVHEMTHIWEFSILFQDSFGRAVRGNPPGWLMEGLASHMAKDEDNIDQMVIRDAVINGLVPPITKVQGVAYLTYRYGRAAFDFITDNWGPEGLRTFLSEYRRVLIGSNLEKPIKEAFGIEADEFDRRFQRYLRSKYLPTLLAKGEPEDYGKEIGFKLPGVMTFSPVLSPSGDLVAVLTNRQNDLDVVILSAKDGEMIKNLTKGFTNDYEFVSTAAFGGKSDLSWSPDGDSVAVFVRRENSWRLLIANALTGETVRFVDVKVANAASPSFSPDGKLVLYSGNLDGIVDIFELNLETEEIRNVTSDEYYDGNPSWSADGKTVLYNRRVDAFEKVFLLDYDDPSRKTQVTFGPTSEITPSFTRDGKRILYASDDNKEGIFNLYSLDLESGEVKQFTDVVGGFFHPQDRPTTASKDTAVASTFYKGRFRLFEVDITKPLKVIAPEERASDIGELHPFEPPLKLTVDDSEKRSDPKKTYHVESAPVVGVGVANDGTVFGDASIIFSDLLGDDRFWVYITSVAEFQNIDLGYVNLDSRLQYNYRFSDYRDFILLPVTSSSFTRVEANRETRVSAGLSYPLNLYYRLEGSLGVEGRDILDSGLFGIDDPGTAVDDDIALLTFENLKSTNAVFTGSLVGDTLRYNPWGPWHGKRFNITVEASPFSSGADEGTFVDYGLDFRAYGRATQRSLFALRLSGLASNGAGATLFGIGGYNQIRGFQFREFIGDRAALANLEFRFPLVDNLQFPFGSIRWVRGLIFFDLGAAWTQDGYFFDREFGKNFFLFSFGQPGVFRDFKFYDSDENALRDARASYGIGFNFRMGLLELNWTFAKRLSYMQTDLSTCNNAIDNALFPAIDLPSLAVAVNSCEFEKISPGGWRSDFYIGYAF